MGRAVRSGPGARGTDSGAEPRTGAGGARLGSAAVGAAAALLLAGCSVTVQPKNTAVSLASTARPTAPATPAPATPPATTPAPTPTASKTPGKDVDHPVCSAVRADLLTAQQKAAGPDKNDKKKLSADFKTVAAGLRTQSTKTKNADLKATLVKMADAYDGLASDVLAGKSTQADSQKIADTGPHLAQLCPQKP